MTDIKNIPIILIHGFMSNESVWKIAKQFFTNNGHSKVYTFNYSGTTHHSIANNARRLWKWLKAKNFETVILIGHSMGGLVARQLILEYSQKVFKLVTLASPHNGALMAIVCNNSFLNIPIPLPLHILKIICRGARSISDMAPGSDFLMSLNGKSLFTYTKGNTLTYAIEKDEIVHNAHITTAKQMIVSDTKTYKNKNIKKGISENHSAILNKKEVLNNVLTFINTEYSIINAGPNLHSGSCENKLERNNTIHWDIPEGSPDTLQMEIILGSTYGNTSIISVPARDKVRRNLPYGIVSFRFFDPTLNITTAQSSVNFSLHKNKKDCFFFIDNHPNIIKVWGNKF